MRIYNPHETLRLIFSESYEIAFADVWQGCKYATAGDINYFQWSLFCLINNATITHKILKIISSFYVN